MKRTMTTPRAVVLASMFVAAAVLALRAPASVSAAGAHAKTIENHTDTDLVVFIGGADGAPEKEGKLSEGVSIRAGCSAKISSTATTRTPICTS